MSGRYKYYIMLYITSGFTVTFGRNLEPSMGDGWQMKMDGGFWIFQGMRFSSSKI